MPVLLTRWSKWAPVVVLVEDVPPGSESTREIEGLWSELARRAKALELDLLGPPIHMPARLAEAVDLDQFEAAVKAVEQGNSGGLDPGLAALAAEALNSFSWRTANERLDLLMGATTADEAQDQAQALAAWPTDWFLDAMLDLAADVRRHVPGPVGAAMADYIRAANSGGDVRSAWQTYVEAVQEHVEAGDLNELAATVSDSTLPSAQRLAAARTALMMSEAANDVDAFAFFANAWSSLMLEGRRITSDDQQQLLDVLTRGIAAAESSGDRSGAAGMRCNLGALLIDSTLLEPEDRALEATRLARDALVIFEEDGEAAQAAQCRSNLALALVRLHGFQADPALLEEAAALATSSLEYRRLHGDPLDMVYSLGHRAAVYLTLSDSTDEVSAVRAAVKDLREAYALSLGVGEDQELSAQVARDLASAELRAARYQRVGRRRLLESAAAHAREAVSIGRADTHRAGLDHGRLAEVLWRIGELDPRARDVESILHHGDAALEMLDIDRDPYEVRATAKSIGQVRAGQGDWGGAQTAFEQALEAHERILLTGLNVASLPGHPDIPFDDFANLARWAAYCMAMNGDLVAAVEVLESSRCRTLGQAARQVAADLSALHHRAPALAERFEDLQAQVASGEPDLAAEASRMLRDHIDEIRRAGFSDFLVRTRLRRFAAHATVRHPLVYLLATPSGAVSLVVTGPAPSDVVPVWAPEFSSGDAIELLVGKNPWRGFTGRSLLRQRTEERTERQVRRALGDALPTLGERLMRPLAEELRSRGAERVTLVATGTLASLPVHAACWREGRQGVTLVDLMPVQFLPAAAFQLTPAQLRQSGETERRLVALGDPSTNLARLEGARAEVKAAAAAYDGPSEVVCGDQATRTFLLREIRSNIDLHLACHASSDLRAGGGARLHLADGDLTVSDLLVEDDSPRPVSTLGLVVAAACASGDVDVVNSPEEATGLAAAFLAAGATYVVTALWPIDDEATQLAMGQLYENMHRQQQDPPVALREAMLWLREREVASSATVGERIRRLRPRNGHRRRPFAHPYYWSALTISGGALGSAGGADD